MLAVGWRRACEVRGRSGWRPGFLRVTLQEGGVQLRLWGRSREAVRWAGCWLSIHRLGITHRKTWLDDRIHWQKSHGSFPWTKIMGLKNHVRLIHDFKFLISFQSYGHLARPWKSSRCRDDYWLRKQLCMILSNQQWLLGRGSLPSSMLLSWVESVVAKTWLQAPWAQSVVRLRC